MFAISEFMWRVAGFGFVRNKEFPDFTRFRVYVGLGPTGKGGKVCLGFSGVLLFGCVLLRFLVVVTKGLPDCRVFQICVEIRGGEGRVVGRFGIFTIFRDCGLGT